MPIASLLEELSHPEYQAALAVILGLLLFYARRFRTGAFLLFAAGAWIYLCSTPAFAYRLERRLTGRYPIHPPSAYPATDAIVVLGGGSHEDNLPPFGVAPEVSRLGFGLRLFQQSRAPVILLSGGNGEAHAMAKSLTERGLPDSSLLVEDSSQNTYENALYASRILRSRHLERILLVTSPLHMPRAAASFRQQGLIVVPAPTLSPSPLGEADSHRWLPRRGMRYLSYRSLREYLARWGYWLRGRA